MNINEKAMAGAAIIAVVALAAGPFVVSNSNLIQSAYAKVQSGTFFYCFSFTTADGSPGVSCESTSDRKLAKQQCEMNREAFAQDPSIATVSKCRELKTK